MIALQVSSRQVARMQITNMFLMTTILSGFIGFTAHGAPTTSGFKLVEIPEWEWYQSPNRQSFLRADMTLFGEPIDHSSEASHTNFPSWGLVVAKGDQPDKVYITNQGSIPLRYLLRRTGTQRYLKHRIPPLHKHIVQGPAVTILCIKQTL
jgi:hypothetical protein